MSIRFMSRLLGALVSAGSLAIIGAATLRAQPGRPVAPFDWCLVCGELGGRDVVLNFLAFVPLGAGLLLLLRSPRRAMVLVALVSAAIEAMQATVIGGRDPTLSDLLTNSAGGWVGIATIAHRRGLLFPAQRPARAMATAWLLAWLAAMTVGGWATRPETHAPGYWGQWAHRPESVVPFEGRIHSLRVDGRIIPDDSVTDPAVVAALQDPGGMEFGLHATPAQPTAGPAPIATVSGETRGNVLLVGQDGRDLVVRVRMRGADAGFRSPMFALADVFPLNCPASSGRACARVGVDVSVAPDRLAFAVGSGGDTLRRTVRLTAPVALLFLIPVDIPAGDHAESFAWTVALLALLPVGYWGSLGWRSPRSSRRAGLTALVLVALALAALPQALALSATPVAAWVGAVVALGVGGAVGRHRRAPVSAAHESSTAASARREATDTRAPA